MQKIRIVQDGEIKTVAIDVGRHLLQVGAATRAPDVKPERAPEPEPNPDPERPSDPEPKPSPRNAGPRPGPARP